HTRFSRDWSSDVCSSDLKRIHARAAHGAVNVDEDRGGGGRRQQLDGRASRRRCDQKERGTEGNAAKDTQKRSMQAVHVSPGAKKIGRASCRERVVMAVVG